MESRSSSTSASSFQSQSFDFGDWLPASELEEIPSPRWLPDSLRIVRAKKATRGWPAGNHRKYSPPEYRGILKRAVVPVKFSTYEELYDRLCRQPILIDHGSKSFGLEKSTGKACCMLSARELLNKRGIFKHYSYSWGFLPKSRFPIMPRALHPTDAFRVLLKVDTAMLSVETTYGAYLVFRCQHSLFRRRLIFATVTTAGLVSKRAVWLEHLQSERVGPGCGGRGWTKKVGDLIMDVGEQSSLAAAAEPRERGDGWMEVELGVFDVGREGDGEEVRICLESAQHQVYTERFYVAVEGVEVRPKEQRKW